MASCFFFAQFQRRIVEFKFRNITRRDVLRYYIKVRYGPRGGDVLGINLDFLQVVYFFCFEDGGNSLVFEPRKVFSHDKFLSNIFGDILAGFGFFVVLLP